MSKIIIAPIIFSSLDSQKLAKEELNKVPKKNTRCKRREDDKKYCGRGERHNIERSDRNQLQRNGK